MDKMLEELAEVVRPDGPAYTPAHLFDQKTKALQFVVDHNATIAQNAEEVDKLRSLCAAVYQSAGAYDMPERFLDAISDAANGRIELRRKTDDLLPCFTPQVADDSKRLKALELTLAEFWAGHKSYEIEQVVTGIEKRADEIMQGDSNDLIRN